MWERVGGIFFFFNWSVLWIFSTVFLPFVCFFLLMSLHSFIWNLRVLLPLNRLNKRNAFPILSLISLDHPSFSSYFFFLHTSPLIFPCLSFSLSLILYTTIPRRDFHIPQRFWLFFFFCIFHGALDNGHRMKFFSVFED